MNIKLEIPKSDFKDLVAALNKELLELGTFRNLSFRTRNQIIEKGRFIFNFQLDEGYDHDESKLTSNAKVIITIKSLAPA